MVTTGVIGSIADVGAPVGIWPVFAMAHALLQALGTYMERLIGSLVGVGLLFLLAACSSSDGDPAAADSNPTQLNNDASAAGANDGGAAPKEEAEADGPLPTEGPIIDSPEKLADLNGVMWLYSTENDLKYTTIAARLDEYKARGTRVLGLYAPYNGQKAKWLGAAPLDYYATPPQCGTVDDFRALVKAAHQRGMKIVTYFVNIYIDRDSAFFKKAEDQYKAGDRTSREVSAVHWSPNNTAAMPQPSAGPGCSDPDLEDPNECTKWRFSEKAGAYYWSLWGEVGFDFNQQGARREVERAMKFWLDTGIDGFMFDAAYVHPAFKTLMTEMPKTYTKNDKWLTFESAAAEQRTALDAFGLTSWFNAADDDEENDYSYVARGSDTANDLETSLKNVDFAREKGKTTFAWSILEGSYPNEAAMRPQEAALLAGAGMLYGAPNEQDTVAKWPAAVKASWEKVLITINANKALLPSASRKRVPLTTGVGGVAEPKAYAMTRTSKDGTQSALLVYNFKSTPMTVTLNLTDTGIAPNQTPKDLYAAKAMPAIGAGGSTYALQLPAYGFEILEVTR